MGSFMSENGSVLRRGLPLAAASAVLVFSGVVHGLWTDRWKVSNEPAASAARLEGVARTVGEWDSRDMEVDARSLSRGGIVGHLARVYTNRRTGNEISVFIACGRPGHVSVHTPDVCYEGAGYRMASLPQKVAGPSSSGADFWAATFRKDDAAAPSHLRIWWSWSAAGPWEAVDHPRLKYARYPALYKVYVTSRVTSPNESAVDEGEREFLAQLLPELRRSLFSDR